MHAKMSGPNEWGTANDYVRHCAAEEVAPGLRVNASAYELREQTLRRMAEAEVRAILAETEPESRAVGISHRSTAYVSLPVLTWERRASALCGVGSVAAALVDALRSFVEDDTRPFVVEATAPRCMTGRPLRIQRRAV